MVEIWQANAAGRYAHPADTRDDVPLEEGFIGFGRSGTADDGWFEFVTLKPGTRAGADGRLAGAAPRRRRLRARAPEAARDAPLLPGRGGGERRGSGALGARRGRAGNPVAQPEDGGLRFDIRLQGEGQTAFFLV